MSAPGQDGPMPPVGASSPQGEEELRAAYEAELSRITAVDMMAQATVTLLNIAARRLAPADEPGEGAAATGAPGGPAAGRDLEQARDAIDAARALLAILERRIPRELEPLRDALSHLQMTFAREMRPGAPGGEARAAPTGAPSASQAAAGEQGDQPQPQPAPAAPSGGAAQPAGEGQRRPGPAESSGRLWVPGR